MNNYSKSVSLVCILVLALTACRKREEVAEPQQPPQQAAKAEEKPVEKPTVAEALEAIRRAHPNSLQSCYDSEHDAFFIEYAIQQRGSEPDGLMHGWQYLKSDKMYKSANGTWFTQDRSNDDYILIFPDVTALPCKKT